MHGSDSIFSLKNIRGGITGNRSWIICRQISIMLFSGANYRKQQSPPPKLGTEGEPYQEHSRVWLQWLLIFLPDWTMDQIRKSSPSLEGTEQMIRGTNWLQRPYDRGQAIGNWKPQCSILASYLLDFMDGILEFNWGTGNYWIPLRVLICLNLTLHRGFEV